MHTSPRSVIKFPCQREHPISSPIRSIFLYFIIRNEEILRGHLVTGLAYPTEVCL